jgi:hypothetical protein
MNSKGALQREQATLPLVVGLPPTAPLSSVVIEIGVKEISWSHISWTSFVHALGANCIHFITCYGGVVSCYRTTWRWHAPQRMWQHHHLSRLDRVSDRTVVQYLNERIIGLWIILQPVLNKHSLSATPPAGALYGGAVTGTCYSNASTPVEVTLVQYAFVHLNRCDPQYCAISSTTKPDLLSNIEILLSCI